MAKKSKNTPRELDINAVAEQLAQTAGIDLSLFPQIYDDALVQHAMEYQASQPQKARQMSPFAQATINAAFAESPAVMTAAGWEHDADGNLEQTKFNSDEVAGLNESLAGLASTASGVALDAAFDAAFDAALPNIIAGINDLRLASAARHGARYATRKQFPSIKDIKDALKAPKDDLAAQDILGSVRARLQSPKVQIDNTLAKNYAGVYKPKDKIIRINPESNMLNEAGKRGSRAWLKTAEDIGAHEGSHRWTDFRGYGSLLDAESGMPRTENVPEEIIEELMKMPHVPGHKTPHYLRSADEFIANVTAAQRKAGLTIKETKLPFSQLPKKKQERLFSELRNTYEYILRNSDVKIPVSAPVASPENLSVLYDRLIDVGFANGGYLSRPSQNTYGVSPRVTALVEKYGADNLRNHFAGGGELPAEESEQEEAQRLLDKKAEAIQRFRAWIPDVENAAKVGYDAERDRWYPYASVEGGPQTIQYGLKLDMANPALDALLKTQLDEEGKGYITSEQANGFLDEDIERRYNDANRIYDNERGTGARDRLSPYSQSLLIDYQYNPGLAQFHKMMQGYDTGNKAQIQAEIGRTYRDSLGVRHPLKDRNARMKLKTDSLETFYPIFDPVVRR